MPLTVKHSKVSPVADGPDTNLVRPSDWNADHQITGLDSIAEVVAVTVNSASPALKITQTGAGNALVVEDAASDSTPFVIDASGKVIVGHTAATSGAYGDNATLFNIGAGFVPRTFSQAYSADAFAPAVELAKSRNATGGAHTIVLSGDELGTVRFAGSDGAAFREAARIQASVDGTPGTNDMPGRLVFSTTAGGASTPTERMRIDRAGNVFVATSSSVIGEKLSVNGRILGTSSNSAVVAYNTTAQTSFMLHVGDAATDQKKTELLSSTSGSFSIRSIDDAYSSSATVISATRGSGITWSAVGLNGNRFQVDTSGNSRVTVATGGLGYGTGAGGTVNQTGGRTTGVTLSKPTGSITLVSAAGSTSWQSFTVTNTVVSAADVVKVCQKSGADKYMIHVTNVAAGSFQITFATTGGTTTEQPVFSFAIIKGATA